MAKRMVNITFDGSKIPKFLMKKQKNIVKEIFKSMNEIGDLIEEEVKESIKGNRAEPRSIDTRQFVRSVKVNLLRDNVGISSDVKQAKLLEHGTSKIKPRRHFSNTVDRNKLKVISIMKNNIRNI